MIRKRTSRASLLDAPSPDRLLAMLLTLSSELWNLRERIAALEAVAARKGAVQSADVDAYEFTEEEAAKLDNLRKDFLRSLFKELSEPAVRPATQRARAARRKK